jgi:hypothetical protein
MQFPDLADLERPRSPEDWEATLRRVRLEFEQLAKRDRSIRPPKPGHSSADPASKSPDLAAARKYLTEVAGLSAARVKAMSPAEVLLLYLSRYHRELSDEVFKSTYLPYPEGRTLLAEADKRMKSRPDTEGARLATLFLPAILKVHQAQARTERRLALLRAIEALRMHVAANAGRLPDKLSQVTVVPVPTDPGTGQPFEYRREGQTATLTSRIPGEPLETSGLRYRLTVRK